MLTRKKGSSSAPLVCKEMNHLVPMGSNFSEPKVGYKGGRRKLRLGYAAGSATKLVKMQYLVNNDPTDSFRHERILVGGSCFRWIRNSEKRIWLMCN
jgi:hypothetical protein